MATSAKSKKKPSETTVTRIKASDSKTPKKHTQAKASTKPENTSTKPTQRKKVGNPFTAIKRYFAGAWSELKQVRWPDRRNTWGMTGALIAFTLVFVLAILLIDYGFSWLFKLIMGTN